jgi:hypothetical protein
MRFRLATVAAAAVLAVGWVDDARADQATLDDFLAPIAPGETEEWSFTLTIAKHGIPNVAYENAETFAVGETVIATITPVVEPEGFGAVALVSDDTLAGTTSDDWNTGEFGEFGELEFAPELTLRYTAPSLADLECTSNPGRTFYGHVGVLADFSGDVGTKAHVDPLLGGQGWVGPAVPLEITCPADETDPDPKDSADLTPPPTHTSPSGAATQRMRPLWPLLSTAVAVGLLVVALSRIRGTPAR